MTPTITPSVTVTPTVTPTITPTITATITPTPTITATITPTPSVSPAAVVLGITASPVSPRNGPGYTTFTAPAGSSAPYSWTVAGGSIFVNTSPTASFIDTTIYMTATYTITCVHSGGTTTTLTYYVI